MNNKNKIGFVVAILVAVILLSVGFAAFSVTININSNASVNPNSADFSIKFSKSANELDESKVEAISIIGANVKAEEAIIDNKIEPTIKNLDVTFTHPGEDVIYQFYVMNTGEYKAYLNNVDFKTSNNDKDFISCKAGSGATKSLVADACKGIIVELTIGEEKYIPGGDVVVQELLKGESKKVTVKISYENGSALADGIFTVNIGNIALFYEKLYNELEGT